MMKITKLPLPTPWTADAAVLHLYQVWSNRGRAQVRWITLANPNMVNTLRALWWRDHQQVSDRDKQQQEEPGGLLAGIGRWRLLQPFDGSGVIVIEQESDQAANRATISFSIEQQSYDIEA